LVCLLTILIDLPPLSLTLGAINLMAVVSQSEIVRTTFFEDIFGRLVLKDERLKGLLGVVVVKRLW